jgi:hypothetical protein
VAGRAHGAEPGVALAGLEPLGQLEPGPGGQAGRLHRAGAHPGVGVDVAAARRREAVERLDQRAVVHPGQVLVGGEPGLDVHERLVQPGLADAPGHGVEPGRALGVADAGLVLGEPGIAGDQETAHRCTPGTVVTRRTLPLRAPTRSGRTGPGPGPVVGSSVRGRRHPLPSPGADAAPGIAPGLGPAHRGLAGPRRRRPGDRPPRLPAPDHRRDRRPRRAGHRRRRPPPGHRRPHRRRAGAVRPGRLRRPRPAAPAPPRPSSTCRWSTAPSASAGPAASTWRPPSPSTPGPSSRSGASTGVGSTTPSPPPPRPGSGSPTTAGSWATPSPAARPLAATSSAWRSTPSAGAGASAPPWWPTACAGCAGATSRVAVVNTQVGNEGAYSLYRRMGFVPEPRGLTVLTLALAP